MEKLIEDKSLPTMLRWFLDKVKQLNWGKLSPTLTEITEVGKIDDIKSVNNIFGNPVSG